MGAKQWNRSRRRQTSRARTIGPWETSVSLQQLANRLSSKIDDREWPTIRTRQFRCQVQSQAMINRGYNLRWLDRAFDRIRANIVALADYSPSFDAAAGEINRPALRPMIASTSRIDFGRASKFGEIADQRVIEHAAICEVFNQRAVTFVVHGCNDIAHAFNRSERLRTVNVPGDFVEHRNESVNRDKSHARFDEASREQAGLSKARHSIALAHLLRFFREIKRLARLGAGHQ